MAIPATPGYTHEQSTFNATKYTFYLVKTNPIVGCRRFGKNSENNGKSRPCAGSQHLFYMSFAQVSRRGWSARTERRP